MLSLVKIESSPSASTAATAHRPASSSKMEQPVRPARAIARTYPAVPLEDDDVLLDRTVSTKAFDAADLERSRPVTPVEVGPEADDDNDHYHDNHSTHSSHSGDLGTDDEDSGVEELKSIWNPRKNVFRMAAVAIVTLNDGLNDSAAGALLPYIERHYGIGYGIVSLIFVACAFGSIIAATILDPMKRRLGRARTLCIGQLLMGLGYVPMLTMSAPFPAVVIGFFVVGLGEAINVAMGNTFCAGLQQSTAALGIMHGSYGLGGISGPLIATAIVVSSGAASNPDDKSASVFGRYYFLPFSLCIFTAVFSAWSFMGYEKDWGESIEKSSSPSSSSSSPAIDPAERRRRWTLGRQRQEQLRIQQQLQEQQEQQEHEKQSSWDRTQGPAVQLTDFNENPVQRPRPVSQPSTAAASRAASRAASPTREASSMLPLAATPSRPLPTPLQSSLPSAFTTPGHSFMSTTPLVAATTPAPSAPLRARRGRTRAQRTKDRLRDMFTTPSSRIILLGAMFLFMYQGSEVSIAGWVTSFLIADRGGTEPTVGYITAGFWAGITVGRFGLAVPAQRVGARRFVYGCVVGAGVFELLVWFVPNVIGDAVAVSVVGLLLGPVYPCAAGILMRGLSRRERVAGVGVMSAFGSAGGAAAPFITGVLAQVVGTFVLHPIVIGLFVAMLVFWYLVPAEKKPTE